MKKARGIVAEILKFSACSQQTCLSLEVQATEMYETYNKKAPSRRPKNKCICSLGYSKQAQMCPPILSAAILKVMGDMERDIRIFSFGSEINTFGIMYKFVQSFTFLSLKSPLYFRVRIVTAYFELFMPHICLLVLFWWFLINFHLTFFV